jgi:hypothetical protein
MSEGNMGEFRGEGEATGMNEGDVIETPQETADFIWEVIPAGEKWENLQAFRAKFGVNPSYDSKRSVPMEAGNLATIDVPSLQALADMDDISHIIPLIPSLYKAYILEGDQRYCKIIDHVGKDEADVTP